MSEMAGLPKRIENLIIEDDMETPSLTNPGTGRTIITNMVGKRIIELSDGSSTIDHIVRTIGEEFEGATPEVIEKHTLDFLRVAKAKGLISWS